MSLIKHIFTTEIIKILDKISNNNGEKLLLKSELLQYLNIKTKAANRGSKSRAGFANHYAIYVLIEDYLNKGFDSNNSYSDYAGAKFNDLLLRQRELPFGSKLQNHALNHRLNEEFKKYFPLCNYLPIVREAETNRYWINQHLLIINIKNQKINISKAIKEIIELYIHTRQSAFSEFMTYCKEIIDIQENNPEKTIEFIKGLLKPNIDARIFEITSFAILKYYYTDQDIYWGYSQTELTKEALTLYKTGRTNANDGGIDFVMKPLGRFFQVTETIDANKYFLDIDKVQRYPVTFVIKTQENSTQILEKLTQQATEKYQIKAVVKKYIESIEEIINIPILIDIFERTISMGRTKSVIAEIALQSRIEFNMTSEDTES